MDNKISQNQEDIELLKLLSNDPARPSEKFESDLKKNFLARSTAHTGNAGNMQNNLSNFNVLMNKKVKYLLIAGGALAAVVIVGVTLVLSIPYLRSLMTKDEEQGIDKEEKIASADIKEILKNALKNNNLNAVNLRGALTESDSDQMLSMSGNFLGSMESLPTSEALPENADYIEFNYTYWKTTYEDGPASEKCKMYQSSYGTDFSSESYNYWDYIDGSYAYKSVSKAQNGELINYSLTRTSLSDEDNSTIITTNFNYRGGDYAVVETYENSWGYGYEPEVTIEDDSTENSEDIDTGTVDVGEPSTEDDFIDLYFGDDAEVVDYVEMDGRYYYVIEWSWSDYGGCSQEGPYLMGLAEGTEVENPNAVDIYNKVWVDEETYEFARQEWYYESVKDENLISRTYSKSENRTVRWDDVEASFENDYSDVEVKDLDVNYSEYEGPQPIKDYLDANKLDVLIANDMKTESLFIIDVYKNMYKEGDLYCARNFYADTNIGQAQYESNCSWDPFSEDYIYAEYEASFGPTDSTTEFNALKYPTLAAYDNSVADQDLIDMMTGAYYEDFYGERDEDEEYDVSNLGTISVTINNSTVTGQVYVYNSSYELYEEYDENGNGIGELEESYWSNISIIFQYGGKKITLSYYSFEGNDVKISDLTVPTFKVLSSGNASQKQELFNMLDEMYLGVYFDAGVGGGE